MLGRIESRWRGERGVPGWDRTGGGAKAASQLTDVNRSLLTVALLAIVAHAEGTVGSRHNGLANFPHHDAENLL